MDKIWTGNVGFVGAPSAAPGAGGVPGAAPKASEVAPRPDFPAWPVMPAQYCGTPRFARFGLSTFGMCIDEHGAVVDGHGAVVHCGSINAEGWNTAYADKEDICAAPFLHVAAAPCLNRFALGAMGI